MKQFQCINCGEIIESEKSCSCTICGYKMYESPYEKSNLLHEEIKAYLLNCLDYKPKKENLIIYREEDDDKISLSNDINRFPSYKMIYDYTTKVGKTEEFLERLEQSISHLKTYCQESFEEKYAVNFSQMEDENQINDDRLVSILEIVSLEFSSNKLAMPSVQLKYHESPDEKFMSPVSSLLEKINELYLKIAKFIKANRLYGAFFKNNRMPGMQIKDDSDFVDLLYKQNSAIQKVLDKKYIVDILSDGSDEAGEMLSCLWKSICLILHTPISISEYTYTIQDEVFVGDNSFFKYLHDFISTKYASIINVISADGFLSDKNENQLFKIYDALLKTDTIGYFGINASDLLPNGESEERLNALIGLEPIKKSIKKIKAYSIANKDSADLNLHMCFYGNPGTGKTEVARIIAGILYESGILPTKKVVEIDRRGLVAEYVGQTAEKTMEAVQSAMGGVLFVDEAYSLYVEGSRGDYGREAIATLIKAMEDYRGKFCVILAGYKNQMIDMIKVNPGFQSRIQFTLDFPNYSHDELQQISKLMLSQKKYSISEEAQNRMLDITDIQRKSENFANAREMRNIIEQVIMCQNVRACDPNNRSIEIIDVNQYIKDANISLPTATKSTSSKALTGEDELDQLIGLASVKRMVKKIKAYAKRNCKNDDFNMHMCFMGNPGTGKTEVARILSRILYDAGVLSEAKLVETDASGLVAQYVGQTAPKTIAKVRDALGGVLFIDEAYSIVDANGNNSSFGDEAIAALIKEMEDKRGQICIILAGYQKEMEQLLSSNPGFNSRLQFTLSFPDYTNEELREISEKFLAKKGYTADTNALDKILEIAEYFRKQPNFANARTIRNIIDQVIMNQNLRAEDEEDNFEIILSDVEDYLIDEGIDLKSSKNGHKIGF